VTSLRRVAPLTWAVLGVATLAMALRAAVPLWVLADTTVDDLLFVRLGNHLAHGRWLGPYNSSTLLKGPGFPAFLAVSERLHLPPLLALQAVHVVAAGVAGLAVARLSHRRWWGFGAYVVLALDPSYYGAESSRLLRDDLYSSLCLLLLGVLALAASSVPAGPRGRWVLGWGVLGGGLLTAYWLTREEHAWLLPSLALLLAALAFAGYRAGGRRGLVSPLLLVLVMGLILGTAVFGVRSTNEHKYGVALVADLAEGEFVRTYGLWESVDAGVNERFVPVSSAQRAAVYEVSPAARELRATLEGPMLQGFSGMSCSLLKQCGGDLTAGFFPYALRGALAATGHETSAREAQRFLRELGDQIASACSSRALSCGKPPSGMLPRSELIDVSAVAGSAATGGGYLLTFGLGNQERPPSSGSAANWQTFALLAGVAATPEAQRAKETGPLRRAHWLEASRWLYGIAAVAALPLALAGYVLALRRRRLPFLLVALGVVAVVTTLARLALLAVIDATSFPAVETSYALPATAPLCLALTIGLWCLWEDRQPTPEENA
jgi:hypothetical protein